MTVSINLKGWQLGIIVTVFVVVLIIILAVLGGLGILTSSPSTSLITNPPVTIPPVTNPPVTNPPVTNPPTPSPNAAVGSLASFSPTNNGQTWRKVFDSSKCFIDFSAVPQISPVNFKKIFKYQVDSGMLPIDNPFKNVIDIPITGCSDDGTRLVLNLDLSFYSGVNPFKQGDSVYIFGIKGETEANSISPVKPRYVYATNKEYPRYVPLVNQIMISDINPCVGNCSLDNTMPLFSNGTYTGGGTVRLVGNKGSIEGFIPQRPMLMYYLYMAYINNPISWPYSPITAVQAYSSYSTYYNGFMQWYANLPQTCTQAGYINATDFVSGPVIVSGGSGTGMEMYVIKFEFMGSFVGFLVVTNDGTGYQNNDTLTISQGSVSSDVSIQIDANCYPQIQNSLTGPLFLSYATTMQQLKNVVNYAMAIDSNINTMVMTSNNTAVVPDNYNDPNITIQFFKTTPDTTMTATEYTGSVMNRTNICLCNGKMDQALDQVFIKSFFPNKINSCANQIIITSDTITNPFDFITNGESIIGTCVVDSC